MKKCRQCKNDKSEEFFTTDKGTCKECRKLLERKDKRQPSKEEIPSCYDDYLSVFITDVEYQKLVSDNDSKVWHSREIKTFSNLEKGDINGLGKGCSFICRKKCFRFILLALTTLLHFNGHDFLLKNV